MKFSALQVHPLLASLRIIRLAGISFATLARRNELDEKWLLRK